VKKKPKARKPRESAPVEPAVLARGTLYDADAALGYVFHRGADGVVRLEIVAEEDAQFTRAAWATICMMLKADFKSLSEMGKRKAPRYRRRMRRRRRFYAKAWGNPPAKTPKPKATPTPDHSADVIAIAKGALKAGGAP
jgi:hypothetical protein